VSDDSQVPNSWVRYRKVANPFSFCKSAKEFAAKEKLKIVKVRGEAAQILRAGRRRRRRRNAFELF